MLGGGGGHRKLFFSSVLKACNGVSIWQTLFPAFFGNENNEVIHGHWPQKKGLIQHRLMQSKGSKRKLLTFVTTLVNKIHSLVWLVTRNTIIIRFEATQFMSLCFSA